MDSVNRFSEKASLYSQARWDYAAAGIDAVVRECKLNRNSVVADIGAGTGMLARHFSGIVRAVFAVEPNAEMRAVAAREAPGAFQIVDGFSDSTGLQDAFVDLVTIGRALHWLPPDSTKAELLRIIKRDGWLAIFQIPCTDQALLDSLKAVRVAENGWDVAADKERMNLTPAGFYFSKNGFQKRSYPGVVRERWEDFLGRISSLSVAPGTSHPLRARFEAALRDVFDRHASDGVLTVYNSTEVVFGQVHAGSH
jgi:SAM-dependent methyltransferase